MKPIISAAIIAFSLTGISQEHPDGPILVGHMIRTMEAPDCGRPSCALCAGSRSISSMAACTSPAPRAGFPRFSHLLGPNSVPCGAYRASKSRAAMCS
jgi:hypothetical protein